jgi:hypothetical protein
MARRVSSSQLRSKIQRAQSQARQSQAKAKRALNDYNAGVRRLNREITSYNSKARAHNARVRTNRDRLRREINRLNSQPPRRTSVVAYSTSVRSLQRSFEQIESSGTLHAELLDLSEGETANSVAALNSWLAEPAIEDATDDEIAELQRSRITNELTRFDGDLDERWRGALFALHPRNPDAARHFCTSSREMLSQVLERAAPDDEVISADSNCPRTQRGTITRRARIRHCLRRRGVVDTDFEAFVETDVDNVISLFDEFNEGTHGGAGRFGLDQLAALKNRVEDAIVFVHRIAG